jgi:hypothetical protein
LRQGLIGEGTIHKGEHHPEESESSDAAEEKLRQKRSMPFSDGYSDLEEERVSE